MHHAITVGGLLLSAGMLLGLVGAVFGAVDLFASGMSDAPQERQGAGCVFLVGGAVLTIGCIAGFFL